MIVAGARPNFMKIAPIAAELARFPDRFAATIVHTGQHYDDRLGSTFTESPHTEVRHVVR